MESVLITRDPGILNGTPVFTGTRVPVRILFEHLEAGDSLSVFLEDFPSVSESQAKEVIRLAQAQVIGPDEAAA